MKKNCLTILAIMLLASAMLTSCAGDGDEKKDSGTSAETTGSSVHIDVGTSEDTTAEPAGSETPADTTASAPDETTAPEKTDPPTESGTFTADDCTVTVAGVKLSIGMDFAPHIDTLGGALGAPEIVEGQACLDGGYDTNYYYGDSIAVYTLAQDGKQVIYDIYITGTELATDKGARVGETTKDKLVELYGEPTDSAKTIVSYRLDGAAVSVSFEFESDVLVSIDILNEEVNG